MKTKYYSKKQLIAALDRKGNIIGKIDKWHAHRNGILHRAFNVALIYKGKYLLHHRKHPLFDGFFDLSASSHQIFENGKLQESELAIEQTLKREWAVLKKDIKKLKKQGEIYYKARNGKFQEHELCEVYIAEVNKLPSPNQEFAYGFSLVERKVLRNKKTNIYKNLTPWTKKIIKEGLL